MISDADIVTALQNSVIALNAVNKTLTDINTTLNAVFPIGTAVTGSAGAATGDYLTILAPDGNSYKIELLALS